MKDAPLAHSLELELFRALRRAILARPHADARRFGARFGRLGHRLVGVARRRAEESLEQALPDLAPRRRRRLARASFESFGAHLFEAISVGRFSPDALLDLYDLEGWEIVDELARTRGGFFLHTGHYGCFELGLHPFGLLLGDVHAVARPADNPHLEVEMRLQRERFGARMLGKIGAAHRMLNLVRRGGRVAIIIDQHIRPAAAVRVPFLGRLAWTSPVLAMLSIRTGAPVVHFTCTPRPGGRYRLAIRPPLWPEDLPSDRAAAEAVLTTRILDRVADDVHAAPELWMWMSRRWRPYLRGS